MRSMLRRQRESGQTIILLALLMGILMVIAALVIDIGTMSQARAEEQYVCDSGALSGIAEVVYTGSATTGIAKARQIVGQCGFVEGQNGVTRILLEPYNAITGAFSETSSDRFRCTIWRTLPQYFASVIGITSTYVQTYATAAVFGTVPIDVSFGATVGFPSAANLAQFGPEAPYNFGDCYSTRRLPSGQNNPRYNPQGYEFDMVIPADYVAATGSNRVRVEIFDANTWNLNGATDPSLLRDTNGDPTEPETGALDEIRSPAGESLSGYSYTELSTQTEWKIVDALGRTVALAQYGPVSNTSYWTHRQRPGSDAINNVAAGDTQQRVVDIKWITPNGFCFDATSWTPPYKVFVRTVSGASENGYSMRVSADRASGVAFNPAQHAVTPGGAFAMYGAGRVPINFSVSSITGIPIGNVPAAADKVTITNFDTDVGSEQVSFTMTSFDASQGRNYPVLFPAPASASGTNVVRDQAGNRYYTNVPGNLSGNGNFASSEVDVPDRVVVPQVDANGNLLRDRNGRIIITDTRDYEGGDLAVSYTAGASDTSVWDVNFTSTEIPPDLRIVLIR